MPNDERRLIMEINPSLAFPTDFWHRRRSGAEHDRARSPPEMGPQVHRQISWRSRQRLYIVVARRSRLHRHHSSQPTRLDRLARSPPETNQRAPGDSFPCRRQGVRRDEIIGSTRYLWCSILGNLWSATLRYVPLASTRPAKHENRWFMQSGISFDITQAKTNAKKLLWMSLLIEPWCGCAFEKNRQMTKEMFAIYDAQRSRCMRASSEYGKCCQSLDADQLWKISDRAPLENSKIFSPALHSA